MAKPSGGVTDLLRYIDQRFKNLEERLERLEHPITRP